MIKKLNADAPYSEHYRKLKIEPTAYSIANGLDFLEGNVIKYVSRYRFKNGLDDLRKAKQYIEWLIEREEIKAGEKSPAETFKAPAPASTGLDLSQFDDHIDCEDAPICVVGVVSECPFDTALRGTEETLVVVDEVISEGDRLCGWSKLPEKMCRHCDESREAYHPYQKSSTEGTFAYRDSNGSYICTDGQINTGHGITCDCPPNCPRSCTECPYGK